VIVHTDRGPEVLVAGFMGCLGDGARSLSCESLATAVDVDLIADLGFVVAAFADEDAAAADEVPVPIPESVPGQPLRAVTHLSSRKPLCRLCLVADGPVTDGVAIAGEQRMYRSEVVRAEASQREPRGVQHLGHRHAPHARSAPAGDSTPQAKRAD